MHDGQSVTFTEAIRHDAETTPVMATGAVRSHRAAAGRARRADTAGLLQSRYLQAAKIFTVLRG